MNFSLNLQTSTFCVADDVKITTSLKIGFTKQNVHAILDIGRRHCS